MSQDENGQQGQPFGGYMYKQIIGEDGRPRMVPDLERPYFDTTDATDAPATTQPSEPKPSRTVWYVSRRTDTMEGAAPTFDVLDATARRLWFGDELSTDEAACARAWVGVVAWIAREFPGCHATRKPSETALALIEHTLPWGKGQPTPFRYFTLPDELRRLIAATGTQHRFEHLVQPAPALGTWMMRRYVLYDARVEFSACLRHLPCILADGYQHDNESAYEPYRPARYLVDVTVPARWAHIGLAPRKRPGGTGWEWPATPGESWQAWLDESELRLLGNRGWPYAVRERILFAPQKAPGNDPMREYRDRLVTEIERVEPYPRIPATRAYRAALRALVIQPVGAWHKGSGTDRRHIEDLDELTSEDGEATIVRDAAGGYTVSSTVELSAFRSRWWRPEWSSAVYARERVAATRKALEVPRAALLAIRGDALHLADFDPDWQDTGRVGSYRKQVDHTFPRPRPTPATAPDLKALQKEVR